MAHAPATRLRRASSLVPLLLASSACLSVPDLGERPQLRAPESVDTRIDAPVAAPEAGWPDATGGRIMATPQLTSLIEAALADSPTMDEAAARVRRAEAIAQQAGARLQPRDQRQRLGRRHPAEHQHHRPAGRHRLPHRWNDNGQASLSLTFDLDLWGRNRATLRAALSDAEAARADAGSGAAHSVHRDRGRLWRSRPAGRGARHRRTYLRIRGDTLRMMQAREAQGLENRAAVMRAESGRAAAAAELAAIDEQIELTRNAIAALIGEGPARGQAITLPAAARLNAFGLPSDLGIDIVGRRPDIVAARLRAEAQGAAHRRRAGRILSQHPHLRPDRPAGARHRQSAPGRLRLRLGRPRHLAADLLGRPDRGRLSRRPRRL